ncbi:MAG TPA: hybrid sensor histidine kinase/response regulator [Candidatus Cloacimonetes bacterium]|nr:hybrid sensor histidine kinase/response regulator [Candidatus Cloacimonadota bacterium]
MKGILKEVREEIVDSEKKKILIVEDEKIIARHIHRTLVGLGYEVSDIVSSGEEAVEKAGSNPPDLILTDIMLEGQMSGIEAADIIRTNLRIPVIYLTAYTDEKIIQEAKIAEPFGYILKPFEERELHATIEMAFYRKKVERELRESERKYRTLVEKIEEGICVVDEKENLTFVNPATAEIFGCEVKELIGRNLQDFTTPDEFKNILDQTKIRRRGETSKYEMKIIRKDGQERIIEVTASPMFEKELFFGSFGILVDVTDTIQTKKTLQELKKAVETMHLGVTITDMDRKIIYSNPADAKMHGYEVKDLIGKDVKMFAPPNLRKSMSLEHVKKWKGLIRESVNIRQDGSTFPVRLITDIVKVGDEPIAMVTTCEDITEQKEAENEKGRIQAQLLQAQKMEIVGQLAGGIAHDFNNLLTVINGYSGTILSKISKTDQFYDSILNINKCGIKAANLTKQLLAFSRKEIIKPRSLNLNKIILDVENMIRGLIGENVNLISYLEVNIKDIKADPGQIEQILSNLVLNARDAISENGNIEIHTDLLNLNEPFSTTFGTIPPGEYVVLSVKDNGCGMNEEILHHLFEPFYTTKEPGKGTGLGLSTVFGIVKQNNGYIFVESEPGKGSNFKIYFPGLKKEEKFEEEIGDESKLPKGDETILLVEDQPNVREFICSILEEFGYNVLEAADGLEALEYAKKYANPVQLLITDVRMPKMNGFKLAENIIKIYPKIRILYVSGYTEDKEIKKGMEGFFAGFLKKPFSFSELVTKVREILDQKSSAY